MSAMKRLLKNKTFRRNAETYLLVTVAFVVMYILDSLGVLGSAMKGYLVPVCAYISLAISLVSSSKSTTWSESHLIGLVTCRAISSKNVSSDDILSDTTSVGW